MIEKLSPVPFHHIKLRDQFWTPRQETNRRVTIQHCLGMLYSKGHLTNFQAAAKGAREGYKGPIFMDSDVYKVVEAMSYSLHLQPDDALEQKLDLLIQLITAAQQPDGYLQTAIQVRSPELRWKNLRDNHELYCAGHLIEAAVAHYQATGKRTLLDVARRLADHLSSVFGEGPGKLMAYGGHPEIELALARLSRVTSNSRYLELAHFFIENRGCFWFAAEHRIPPDKYDGRYWQDDVLIREHKAMQGHAVRATYLFSGVADLGVMLDDPSLLSAAARVWESAVQRRRFFTGGIGSAEKNEGFTEDYDLPNAAAYQESCATIGLAMLSHRLLLAYGEAKYADVLEEALYNALLAGVGLDGKHFFYTNPLQDDGNHRRAEWFDCACCPPNIARTLAAIGGYAYAVSGDSLWVNLFMQGSITTDVGVNEVTVFVKTDYPWDGSVQLVVKTPEPTDFTLRLRIPGWCSRFEVRLNGQETYGLKPDRGYIQFRRRWMMGDWVELKLDMSALRMEANPLIKADRGRVALRRGPLAYCFEQADQDLPLPESCLPPLSAFAPVQRPNLLGGIVTLEGEAQAHPLPQEWGNHLYDIARPPRIGRAVAIPYAYWANREPGPMAVWMPVAPPQPAE